MEQQLVNDLLRSQKCSFFNSYFFVSFFKLNTVQHCVSPIQTDEGINCNIHTPKLDHTNLYCITQLTELHMHSRLAAVRESPEKPTRSDQLKWTLVRNIIQIECIANISVELLSLFSARVSKILFLAHEKAIHSWNASIDNLKYLVTIGT